MKQCRKCKRKSRGLSARFELRERPDDQVFIRQNDRAVNTAI